MLDGPDFAFELRPLDSAAPRWIRFISEHQSATIFHHPKWLSVLKDTYGFRPFLATVVSKTGDILAGVPIMEKRGLWGKNRWFSLPFSDHCEPLSQKDEYPMFMTLQLLRLSEEKGISDVELRWDYPGLPNLHKTSRFILSRLSLPTEPSDLAKRIKSKHFRQIEVAYKKGVEVKWGTEEKDLSAFYDLHCQTRRRLGVPVQPWKFFKKLFESIIQTGNGFLLLSMKGNKYLAAALFLHWNKTLTYKYSASAKEATHFYAIDPIIWTAICWGCQNGFLWMDLGRTEVENQGLRKFKHRWGAEEIPLSYSHSPHAPQSSFQERLLPLFSVLLKRSPVWFCKLSGRMLYRFSS